MSWEELGGCEQPEEGFPAEGRAPWDHTGLGEREWLLSVPWGVGREVTWS